MLDSVDNWDKEGLSAHVKNLDDNPPLNTTQLGVDYGLPNHNNDANKIVKQFLLENNVDLTRFDKNGWRSTVGNIQKCLVVLEYATASRAQQRN